MNKQKRVTLKLMGEAEVKLYPRISKKEYDAILPILEKYGINLQTENTWKRTILDELVIYYCQQGMLNRTFVLDMVRFLVEKGADINHQPDSGFTILHMAAHWRFKKAVQVFFELGASLEILNNLNRTPLGESMLAFEDDKPETVSVLLKAGADRHRGQRLPEEIRTPEEFALTAPHWFRGEQMIPIDSKLKDVYLKTLKEMGLSPKR
ncbi:MAG: ankyrin repeat domain-containing protein [Planctomycetia bacterium]|nr:ankyrin repeat domain-containing protein [Planctomycetia bacterium]